MERKLSAEDKLGFEAQLKAFARTIGIDLLGITTAEPFEDGYQRLQRMQELGYLSPWAEPDAAKRCNPRMLMAEAQSLIAVAVCYPAEASLEGSGKGASSGGELERCFTGKLARFACLEDYHQVLRRKLEELVAFIRRAYPEVKAQIFVDTGPLLEREVAYRAGLGFIGKNAALINPEYGSFLALGEVLLNIHLKPDQPLENGCGECELCMEACPQQAIKAPGEIASGSCLAHYTQEKGYLEPGVRSKIGNRLWGCDTCQEVCPYNRQQGNAGDAAGTNIRQDNTKQPTTANQQCNTEDVWQMHTLGARPDLQQILTMSNKDYQRLVGQTAMAWRGKTVLQRNALINLGNLRDPAAISLVKPLLSDVRPVIRAMAVWALQQIGGEEATQLVQQALTREGDVATRLEMEKTSDVSSNSSEQDYN